MTYKNVLIVHPDDAERALLKEAVNTGGIQTKVKETGSGAEAELLIKEWQFDLILSSILLKAFKVRDFSKTQLIGLIPDDSAFNIDRLEQFGIKHFQVFPGQTKTLSDKLTTFSRSGQTRQYPRYDVPGTVVIFHTESGDLEGKVLNISEGGFLCEMIYPKDVDLDKVETVPVTIQFPGRIGGRVIHRVTCNYLATRNKTEVSGKIKALMVLLLPKLEERDFGKLVITFQRTISRMNPLFRWRKGRLEINVKGKRLDLYGVRLHLVVALLLLILGLIGLAGVWGKQRMNEYLGNTQPLVSITYDRILLGDKIEFGKGADLIQSVSKPMLNDLVGLLKKNSNIHLVTIDGHTDSAGHQDDNLRLSLRRAEMVKAYLVSQGINSKRLKTRGFGDARPIGDNTTEIGRQLNRRVEFIILERN